MSDPLGDKREAFERAREGDESFWQTQERRIQGATSQPCCTLSGISAGLAEMTGNFAVIIHGESECAACFYHFGPSAHRFFSTDLGELHFTCGQTAEPLQQCLRAVAEDLEPEAIFVLGTCPMEVIGDRFEEVVAEVQPEFPAVAMIPMHTSGLKVGSQANMLDWLFSTLAALPAKAPVPTDWMNRFREAGGKFQLSRLQGDEERQQCAEAQVAALLREPTPAKERCLNLLGLPRGSADRFGRECKRVLEEAGLHITGNYPYGASFDDWRAITYAPSTFMLDATLYPKLIDVLTAAGREAVEIPLPVGVQQTEAFYLAIAEKYDAVDAVRAAIVAPKAAAQRALEQFRDQHAGLRIAMGLRMLNNYATDQLAQQGLGDYQAFAEMGFDITLLVQGPPEKKDGFAKLFEAHDITHPFLMFPEPWTISRYLDGGRYDVCYLADHCRAEAQKAGVPMIVSRSFEPFFSGVADNLRMVSQKIRSGALL